MAKYIFPIDLARGAWSNTVTPSWTTTEQTTASGRYRGLTTQTAPKYDFSYTFNAISERELNNILEFYNARKGTLQPFFVSDSVPLVMTDDAPPESCAPVEPDVPDDAPVSPDEPEALSPVASELSPSLSSLSSRSFSA